MRTLVGEIALTTLQARSVEIDVDAQQLAIEDGLRLHRLINPESTGPDAFLDALEVLQRLVTAENEP
jgi:hypothetical protein